MKGYRGNLIAEYFSEGVEVKGCVYIEKDVHNIPPEV